MQIITHRNLLFDLTGRTWKYGCITEQYQYNSKKAKKTVKKFCNDDGSMV